MKDSNIFGGKMKKRLPVSLNKYFRDFGVKSEAPNDVKYDFSIGEYISPSWLAIPSDFELDSFDSEVCSILTDYFSKHFGSEFDLAYGVSSTDDFVVEINFKDVNTTCIKFKYDGDVLFLDLCNAEGFSTQLANKLIPALEDLLPECFSGVEYELY